MGAGLQWIRSESQQFSLANGYDFRAFGGGGGVATEGEQTIMDANDGSGAAKKAQMRPQLPPRPLSVLSTSPSCSAELWAHVWGSLAFSSAREQSRSGKVSTTNVCSRWQQPEASLEHCARQTLVLLVPQCGVT